MRLRLRKGDVGKKNFHKITRNLVISLLPFLTVRFTSNNPMHWAACFTGGWSDPGRGWCSFTFPLGMEGKRHNLTSYRVMGCREKSKPAVHHLKRKSVIREDKVGSTHKIRQVHPCGIPYRRGVEIMDKALLGSTKKLLFCTPE